MPFVLRNAAATFQRSLDLIIPGVHFKTCLVYLEDLFFFLRKLEEHIKHIEEVIMLLAKAVVSLKIRKCQFFQNSPYYFGHVQLPGHISIAKNSTSAIADSQFHKT